jgi:tetrapyrrole methylase family protein / MazG family protein
MNKPTIWIIGLHSQILGNADILTSAGGVLARGNLAARWLTDSKVQNWETFPSLHTEAEFAAYFKDQLEKIDKILSSGKDFVYITASNPISTDHFVKQIVTQCKDVPIRWVSGRDFSLDEKVQPLFSGSESLAILDGFSLAGKYHLPVDPSQSAVIYYPNEVISLERLSFLLRDIYPTDHDFSLLLEQPDGQIQWNIMKAEQLAKVSEPALALALPARSPDSSLISFEELIAHLRAPEGCPWDKKQTHDSLRKYLLEETYEALDALDQNDLAGLQEELGDIVLQIALHAQIATENHEFNMADILEGINRKIVYRHPHIFGDTTVDGVKGVLQNWEKLKEKERAEKGVEAEKGLLDGIPQSFPALAQAQAIQDRAAHVGFDWTEIEPVMAKVLEEFDEVKTAPNDAERAKELGDLLFAVVNLVRWYKVDAESALRGTNLKFRRRFAYIEKNSRELKKPMQDMTLDEMDNYWNEAKKFE